MTNRLFAMISLSSSAEYTMHALTSLVRHTEFTPKDRLLIILNDDHRSTPLKNLTLPDKLEAQTAVITHPTPLSFAENGNLAREHAILHRGDLYLLNNDIIFTDSWDKPLRDGDDKILLPYCNQQLQYEQDGWLINEVMDLSEYLGNEEKLEVIVKKHQKSKSGLQKTLNPPYYCVKIPLKILEAVGQFDTRYGRGGGEDGDYSLRTYLAGFSIHLVKDSYLLHFMGKSTWRGGESREEVEKRNEEYFTAFRKKWGDELTEFILSGNRSLAMNHQSIAVQRAFKEEEWKRVIEGLYQNE